MDTLQTDRLLRGGIGFTTTELNVNRVSGMTDSQRGQLERRRRQLRLQMAAVGVIGVALALLAVVLVWMQTQTLWGLPLALLVLAGSARVGVRRLRDLRAVEADLRLGAVMTVAGPARLSIEQGWLVKRCCVMIGDEAFMVSDRVLRSFKHGDRYYVHYAPHARLLFSAESVARTLHGSDESYR